MRTTLGSLAEPGGIQTGPFGSQLHAHEYSETGVPVVMPQDLGENVISTESVARVPEEIADRLDRHRLTTGDIVYSRRGDITKRAWVLPSQVGWLCGTGCLRVRLNPALADSRFVSYALGLPETRTWLTNHAVGATMPNLNTSILSEVPVDVPNLATQTAIADVLGALDDKIAANERMLELSLRLRSAIFDSLPKPLLVPMSDLARFVNGRNFTKDATGSGRPVIRIAELNNGITSSTVWNEVLAADDNLGRAGDILFAWSGSLTVTRWTGAEGLVNQHIFKVLTSGLPVWVVYHVLLAKLIDYKSIAADKATTMGHIQRGHLDEPVPTPTLEEVARVDGTMSALWSAELSLRIENSRLAATRNAFLPELMSGRLTVGGVQQGPS